jgi:GNAT superfamily N-acetyltransferase
MLIRPSTPADVPQVIRLIGDVWAEYGCVLNTAVEEQYLLAPGEFFRDRNGEFWVVEADSTVIATVAVMMLDQSTAELKSLYVHPKSRQMGLGEQLTRMAIDFALGRSARRMVLWTDTRFEKAHRLYERLGFVRTGTRRLDDINDTTEYGFELSLI